MEKKQEIQALADDALNIVTGGAKTTVEIDDTKMAHGSMCVEIEGETVTLVNDGESGYKGTVNGKEYRFTDAEVAEMLRQMMGG